MSRHIGSSGEVYRLVVESQQIYWYGNRISGSRNIYGPWANKAAATRKKNEIARAFETLEKEDWRNKLYTNEVQRAVEWENV